MKGAQTKARPLSPHLTIYRPQITSVLSISHRASGFFLYFGLLIFSWFLIFSNLDATFAAGIVDITKSFFASIVGKIALFFWTLALYYHFCNGIRHLIWDAGYCFSIKSVKVTGVTVVIVSVALTLFTWFNGISTLVK